MKKQILIAAMVSMVLFFSFLNRGHSGGEYEFEPGSAWQRSSDYLAVTDGLWSWRDDDEVNLTLMSHGNSSVGAKLNKDTLDDALNSFTSGRRAILKLQGVTDWQISSSSLSEQNNVKVLHLEGKYTSSRGALHFLEDHYFLGAKYYEVALIYPEKSAFAHSNEQRHVLNTFKLREAKKASL